MDEILRISDEVTIMRDGKWVQDHAGKDLTMGTIIKAMVGRELTNRFPPKDNHPGQVCLQGRASCRSLYGNNAIQDISFTVVAKARSWAWLD
jgi:methyl-galactoside transport system ATP-binding protein